MSGTISNGSVQAQNDFFQMVLHTVVQTIGQKKRI